MKVGSLFSGIGGLDLGLERAGMEVVWQCESDPWRRTVLAARFPGVRCYSDVRLLCGDGEGMVDADPAGTAIPGGRHPLEPVDLICGGSPCQDLSVAGRRAGLEAGSRSSLFFDYVRIVGALRPTWVLFENVPGLLSSHGGRDFAIVLASLAELGYGVCWRVLDSRFFGVAQRRRRVFVVGHLGARSADPFVPFLTSGGRHPSSSGQARSDVASTLTNGSGKRGWQISAEQAGGGHLVPMVAKTLKADGSHWKGEDHDTYVVAHALTAEGYDASEDGTGRGTPLVADTLRSHPRPGSNTTGALVVDDRGGEQSWVVTNDSCPVVAYEETPALKIGTGLGINSAPVVVRMREGKDGGGQGSAHV